MTGTVAPGQSRLAVLPETIVAVGPWGTEAAGLPRWLAAGETAEPSGRTPVLDNLVGFVASPFINLASHALTACLASQQPAGTRPVAIVLASVLGDTTSADKASTALAERSPVQPLLFYQSVPVAVLGQVTAGQPIDGPLVCLSGGSELCESALETAELMLLGGEAEQVLICYVEAGAGRWRAQAGRALADLFGEPVLPEWDCAISLALCLDPHADQRHRAEPPSPGLAGAPAGVPRPARDFIGLVAGQLASPASPIPEPPSQEVRLPRS